MARTKTKHRKGVLTIKQTHVARDTLHVGPHSQLKIRDQIIRQKQLWLACGEGQAEGQLLEMGEAVSVNDNECDIINPNRRCATRACPKLKSSKIIRFCRCPAPNPASWFRCCWRFQGYRWSEWSSKVRTSWSPLVSLSRKSYGCWSYYYPLFFCWAKSSVLCSHWTP